jgi:thiol:disulfide interchange protein DsbD
MFFLQLFFLLSCRVVVAQVDQLQPTQPKSVDQVTTKYVTSFIGFVSQPFIAAYDTIVNFSNDYLGISLNQDFEKTQAEADKQRTKRIDRAFGGGVIHWWDYLLLFLTMFLAGWSVSLTPCIYPLIPITIGVITSGRTVSFGVTILRALFYVLGLASVFSLLGYISATSGMIFGQWMSNPIVAGIIFVYFIVLALSMLGIYDISFGVSSSFLPSKMNFLTAFLFGGLTGVITSPCLTPPLMVILSFVAKQANVALGVSLLFFFALGMCTILLALAFFSGLISLLPRPGEWMIEVKRALGLLIVFFAINVLSPFLERYQTLLAYGLLSFFIGIYYLMSSKKDAVLSVLRAHRDEVGDFQSSMSGVFSAKTVGKKILAFVALGWAMFFFARSYTKHHKTTVKKLLIRHLS